MTAPEQHPCPMNAQAVGLALHALEPDEEMEVLLHLPQCTSCRTATQEAGEVLAGLGVAVEQVEPPRGLRDSLMDQVARTPQLPPVLPPLTSPESASDPGPEPGTETPPAPRHRRESDALAARPPTRAAGGKRPDGSRRPGGSWLSRRGRRVLAASLALVAILSIGGLAVRTMQLEQQRDAETAQAQSIADMLTQLDRPGAEHALLAAPDGQTMAAVLVADGQRKLITVGMPPNQTDRDTYVLWGLRSGVPAAIGTFDVAPADPGTHSLGPATPTEDFSAYAISLEPGRTAPPLPSQVVASGQVQA